MSVLSTLFRKRNMSKGIKNIYDRFLQAKSNFKREREARRRSREIDAQLARTSRKPVVVLLEGSRYSGKTTLLKHMRIIHGQGFSHEELLDFRNIIYQNILSGMQSLVEGRNRLGIPLQNPANEMHEMLVNSADIWMRNLEPHRFQEYAHAIYSLWKDSGIQEASKRIKLDVFYVSLDSFKYFIDNIDRIGQLSYIPSAKDVVFAYTSRHFSLNYFVYHNFYITKGRFYNRRQYHHFENGTLLFTVDSSAYNELLFEENNLVESLNLFKAVLNNRFLQNSIILFLNKTDLLAEKVQTADIREHFPEFTGDPHSLEDVQRFLVRCFSQVMENDRRPFIYHFITAVDTENVRTAFNSVTDTILQENLKHVEVQ